MQAGLVAREMVAGVFGSEAGARAFLPEVDRTRGDAVGGYLLFGLVSHPVKVGEGDRQVCVVTYRFERPVFDPGAGEHIIEVFASKLEAVRFQVTKERRGDYGAEGKVRCRVSEHAVA